ncbi:MAG: protease Do, partial [Parcubacteria group bacterium GW2011_GWC1_45_13]
NDGGWHHYTVTYDGSSFASGIKIYEDGISLALNVASDSLTGSILNNVNVEIGDRDSGASSLNYPGLIDEVRIYNRALSGDEIKRLYNLGR